MLMANDFLHEMWGYWSRLSTADLMREARRTDVAVVKWITAGSSTTGRQHH
jgi:hypothetical protein